MTRALLVEDRRDTYDDLTRPANALAVLRWWSTRLLASPEPLEPEVRARYSWVPREIIDLVESVESVVSKDEKTWLLTVRDFNGSSESAFSWNEWERLSLDATDDPASRARISQFWDGHFPLFASVRFGYAYLALERGTLNIVEGDEPEFEEARLEARSLGEMLQKMAQPARATSRWT